MRTNVRKTVGMVCKPYWAFGVQTDKAYTRRMKGERQSFKAREGIGKGFTGGAPPKLSRHEKRGSVQKGDKEGGGDEPRNSRMAFHAKAGLRTCPVKGCSDRAVT